MDSSFIKKFVVAMVAFSLIAGALLSNKLFGMGLGNYLLFSLVPLAFGLLLVMALMEKSAGILAFAVVGAALFAYLLLIEPNKPKNFYILSGIGMALGALVYFFQIKEKK